MDVWTINEKLKAKIEELKELKVRVSHIESYLMDSTGKTDEKIQNKSSKSSGVRTRRRTTKKSKGKK